MKRIACSATSTTIITLTGAMLLAGPVRAQSPTRYAGEWKLAFTTESNSGEPNMKPAPWISFSATVVQVDSTLGGAMRSDGPSGQFGCRLRDGACTAGRMRLSWDDQDWQLFQFTLDSGSATRGTGRAEIRFPNGAVDKYTFVITRAATQPAPDRLLEARTVRATSNPILSDGADYTTDPAPLVVGDKLYIVTGRDTAGPRVNDFKMPEWQMLVTSDEPMAGKWTHYPHLARPEDVFKWAAPGRAYAAHIVQGPSGKFYLYAPVVHAAATTKDKFAIGVAVADSPLGPWTDAHPEGPVVSQSVPIANDIQNIDPTVLVDDDQRVYLYWGTFGRLKGVELERDMVTFKGTPVDVHTLNGFFEASWLFKRNGTYYMAYAANTAGPNSDCTEAVYYACIAYGTSPSPLGPWTYRGVILDPVSSTTSHPGIVQYKGTWYITYHTADAKNGGHFRRSVAIDKVEWDDAVSPPRMKKIVATGGPPVDVTPIANIASHARITASNVPVPVQYWLRAVNDGKVRESPLPPDMWATWSRNNPPQQWILYQWEQAETLTGASLHFWGDHAAGSGIGVAPPKDWHLEYWDGAAWQAVVAKSPYTSTLNADNRIDFAPVTTRCLRAVFDASTDGASFAAVALQEWEVFSTRARPVQRPSVKGVARVNCG